jgi:hypothetical protein
MPVQTVVLPFGAGPAFLTAENLAIEVLGSVQIVNRKGIVKGSARSWMRVYLEGSSSSGSIGRQ